MLLNNNGGRIRSGTMEWLKKDEQVAQVLRGLIESGEWSGQLPGYRKLERRLHVNRVTIERALDRLESEHLVGSAQQGKRRVILNSSPRQESGMRHQTLLVVGPRALIDFTPTQRAILTGTLQLAESEGWKPIYEYFDFGFPRKAVTQIKRLVADYRPTRIILMLPGVSLAHWAATKSPIPCFSLGGEVTEVRDRLDGAAVSFNQIVCDAGALLRAQGHRRILIPMVSGKVLFRDKVIQASAESWAADIPIVELKAMFAEQGDWLPDVLKGFWPKAFARLGPTAVIVKENHEYLSLLSYCHRKGIRIPKDLSVIQLSSDPGCAWLDPIPDRFEFPVEKICRRALHWLQQTPHKPHGFESVPAIYLRGGTVAIARKD